MSRQAELPEEGHMSFIVSRFKSRSLLRQAALSLATVDSLSLAVLQPAAARGGWDPGAAAAVGVIGGLALGAALSNQNRGYGGTYGYTQDYGYGRWHHRPHYGYGWAPPPEDCYVTRERVWVPGWGWDIRPRTVCD